MPLEVGPGAFGLLQQRLLLGGREPLGFGVILNRLKREGLVLLLAYILKLFKLGSGVLVEIGYGRLDVPAQALARLRSEQ